VQKEEINLFPYTRPTAIKIPEIRPSGMDKAINLRVTNVPSNTGGKSISRIKVMFSIFILPTFRKVQLFYEEIVWFAHGPD